MLIEVNNEISYEIVIGSKLTNENLSQIVQENDYFVCIDSRVNLFFADYLQPIINNAQDCLIIEATEDNKSMETVNTIHNMLFRHEASRSSTIIAIGGGIIGDVVGLAAALYMRGINLIQVPTTLLAQVDSSIGNKVAVNCKGTKNSLGTFYAPSKVIIDLHFLTKLTTRIFKEGLVELIKHGIIKDISILEDLENYNDIFELRNDYFGLENLITKSLQVKKSIVEQDPLDKHVRHILNLGHTFAHALELSDNDLYHGEAVAFGLLVSANATDLNTKNIIFDILTKFKCIRNFESVDLSKIFRDKKRKNNHIKEVYLNGLGDCVIKEVEIESLLNEFVKSYAQIQQEIVPNKPIFCFKPVSLEGEVIIPPSKSQLHRYLIGAALSGQKTILDEVTSVFDDVCVTMEALQGLGMHAVYNSALNQIVIDVLPDLININSFHMKESGTSLRLLLPLLLSEEKTITITGENKLPLRPMDSYLNIFKQMNIDYSTPEDAYLPLEVSGCLKPGKYELPGDVSSQFISGLLFALPLLNDKSTIVLSSQLQSIPYVEMTLQTLKDFNINVKHNNDFSVFEIEGKQKYQSKGNYEIEQDYSSRCFFEVAKSFDKHDITIKNKVAPTLQGDSFIVDVVAHKLKCIDLTNIPDAACIMAVYFAFNGGTMMNTERLRFKESNRLKAICDFLTVMNIEYHQEGNKLIIEQGNIKGGYMNTYDDHRITMSIIIASTIASKAICISEISSINKSFTTFLNIYEQLGGFIDEQ